MTIKEFAVKYTIPYHVAYKASFRVKPIATMQRDRDYDEDALYEETIRYTKRRLREIKELYCQYVDSLKKLRNDQSD